MSLDEHKNSMPDSGRDKMMPGEDSVSDSHIENLLEDSIEPGDLDESIEHIKDMSVLLRRRKGKDISVEKMHEVTVDVLASTQMILAQSRQIVRRTRAMNVKDFTEDAKVNSPANDLYSETLRLQQTLQTNLEYIQSLELTACDAIGHKKKKIKIYQIVCVFLAAMLISSFFYYKYGLSLAQQRSLKSYISKKITKIQIALRLREEKVRKKEKVLQKQEKQLGKKEKKLGQKEQKLGKKEQILGTKERVLKSKESTIAKKEQDVGKKEQLVQKKQKILALRKKILKEHVFIDKRLINMSSSLEQLQKKLQAFVKIIVSIQEDTRTFFDKAHEVQEEVQPRFGRLSKEILVTIAQPSQLKFQKILTLLKSTILDTQNEIRRIHQYQEEIATARKSGNFSLMRKQVSYQKKIREQYRRIEIQRQAIFAVYAEEEKVARINKVYFTFRTRNFADFLKYFRNMEEISERHQKLLQHLQKLRPLPQELVVSLKDQEKQIRQLNQLLHREYNGFTNTALDNLTIFMKFFSHSYEELLRLPLHKNIASVQSIKNNLAAFQKSTALMRQQVVQSEKIFAALNSRLEKIEKRLDGLFFSLKKSRLAIIREIKKRNTTVYHSPAQIRQSIPTITSFWRFDPAVFFTKITEYRRQGNQFRISYQMKIKCYQKWEQNRQYFMVKFLHPQSLSGNVLLQEKNLTWLYRRETDRIERIHLSQMESTYRNLMLIQKFINIKLPQDKLNPEVKEQISGGKKYYGFSFQLEPSYEGIAAIVLWISARDSSPTKIELFTEHQQLQTIFYIRSVQKTPLGDRVRIVQALEMNNKNSLVQLQFYGISGQIIPTYYFKKDMLRKIK